MKFTYDKEFELNILEKMQDKYSPGSFALAKKEIVEVDISKNTLKAQMGFIENAWNKVADNFYKQLGNFYEKTLTEPDLTCRLIRLWRYPYNYKGENQWFCAPLFGSPIERNRVVMHELCHYFQPSELPRYIKEAIPVILNDHDVYQMYGTDRGHNDEQEQLWRKKVWDIYKNGGKYSDILKEIK